MAVSLASVVHATSTRSIEPAAVSTPARISFSSDLVENNITTNSETTNSHDIERGKVRSINNVEFEFLSSNISANAAMLTADELFFEGKLLPFSQMDQQEKLQKITLKPKEKKNEEEDKRESVKESSRASWLMDEDPSPRPPTCTVLWKELLKLKKHHHQHHHAASTLSPSSSSSSSSSGSMVHMESIDEGKEEKEGRWSKEKHVKRIKKGLERTRSASFRIRPMVNVPICTQPKNSTALPTMFPFKKGNVER